MRRDGLVVAIDGPAGSGKTTVSREVARRLGYIVLDTGALYRAVALSTARSGLEPGDPRFEAHCRGLVADDAIAFEAAADGESRVRLHGEDVSKAIRTPEISERTSVVSTDPALRRILLDLQRRLGEGGGVVVEGRDIGSVVFPDAEAKFFLTASVEQRAQRRFSELQPGATGPSLGDVQEQVRARDARDSQRAAAPLRRAEDAVLLDSTHLGVEEVVEQIVRRVLALRSSAAGPESGE